MVSLGDQFSPVTSIGYSTCNGCICADAVSITDVLHEWTIISQRQKTSAMLSSNEGKMNVLEMELFGDKSFASFFIHILIK